MTEKETDALERDVNPVQADREDESSEQYRMENQNASSEQIPDASGVVRILPTNSGSLSLENMQPDTRNRGKLQEQFARLTTERWNLRRNVSFNNVSAFPAMPTGEIKASSSNLSLVEKFQAAAIPTSDSHQGTEPEPVFMTKKLVVVMVGLPARGKSYISQALSRYLNWLGYHARVFNVGSMRRKLLGTDHKAKFFDPANEEGSMLRWQLALETMNDMTQWLLEDHGNVAVFDATNSTYERRQRVYDSLQEHGIRVLFLESICTDQSLIDRNITATKMFSPDYVGHDPEEAVMDFKKRIANYEKAYESLGRHPGENEFSYLQTIDAGRRLVLNEITGFIQGKIVSYLMNTHIMPRTIYLSRHGESKWNVTGQLGGDPPLTERGKSYAFKLAEFINEEFLLQGKELPIVWSSQLRRTRQTVEMIPTVNVCWRALNEIDAGKCEGMTYDEIKKEMPEVAAARKKDKLRYRYPQGESYVDVIQRIEPVILELERQREPVLIVAHNAIIRAIYSYYMGVSQEECPNLDIPLHHVFKIFPRAYKCDCELINLQVDNIYNNKTPDDTPKGNSPQQPSSRDDLHNYVSTHFEAMLDAHGNVLAED